MPQYCYHCSQCDQVFFERHSYKIKLNDCPKCDQVNCLSKVITDINYIKSSTHKEKKVGQEVNRSIQEAKKELKQEKDKLKKERKK